MKDTVTVYIFDGFYTVHEGDLLNFDKKYGSVGQKFAFFTDIGKPVIGIIVKASEDSCSLGILIIDEKEEVISGRPNVSKENKEVKEDTEKIEEITDTKVNFDSMTKKELVAYIKENNLPIETNKVNKATILEELKKF